METLASLLITHSKKVLARHTHAFLLINFTLLNAVDSQVYTHGIPFIPQSFKNVIDLECKYSHVIRT